MARNINRLPITSSLDMRRRLISYLNLIYVVFIFAVYPLLFWESYDTLADLKYISFYRISIGYCILQGWLVLCDYLRPSATEPSKAKKVGKKAPEYVSNIIRTDDKWLFITGGAYIFCAIISYLNSDYKETALHGIDGWNMGLTMQILLLLLFSIMYLSIHMVGIMWPSYLLRYLIIVSSSIVMLLGIIQSYGVDVFNLYKKSPLYDNGDCYTTMGQSSWYSGYLVLIVAFAFYLMVEYMTSKKVSWSVAIYISYLAITLLAVVRLNAQAGLGATAIIILVYIFVKWHISGRAIKAQRFAYLMIAMTIVAMLVFIIVNSMGLLGNPILGPGGLLYFDDYWGNRRGVIWKHTINIFGSFDFTKKLFGIGPDCYYNVFNSVNTSAVVKIFPRSSFYCAHNELLNSLICYGIVGVTAYMAFFISTIRCIAKHITIASKSSRNHQLATFCIACVFAYLFHNFFCYQTYYNTPMIFVIIGIVTGENAYKSDVAKVEASIK